MTRRRQRILGLAVLLAGLPVAVFAGAMTGPSRDFFPVSAWYAGGKARAPMLETVTPDSAAAWRRDLEQIKGLGFNTVRTWIEWTACEKDEDRYDFSALKLVADLAGEVGLRVIVQVYIDSAPDWVGRKYPEARFVASNGVAVQSQAAPGFCFDHPGVRDRILRFFSEAARAVKGRPAFYGWDLWSEPHIINWAEVYYVGDLGSVQFCYCPSTQARFREWLKARYGTVEDLNAAWYRTFRAWEEVEPPRFGTILTYTDYIDWKEFISDKLAEDLKLKADAVRAVVPEGVVTSHSATPGLFSRPDWAGTPDDRKMADSVDYFGTSIYPKHAWTIKPWSPFYRASGLDFVRSMGLGNGGFYIGELQAGYGVFGMKMSFPVVGADLRDWIWSTVAYGARAVNIYAYYPMSTGYEGGGYGLVELDGKVTERAVEAGRIAGVISARQDLLLGSVPARAEIAVVYNPLSHMVGGQQAYTGEGQTIGLNNLSESLQGIHRVFYERHIPVDFLHVRDLRPERLTGYKLLIVPYPVMMSRPHVQQLVDYVRAGGTLVAEARCGWVDERGFSSPVIPGGGLDQVFGCRETELRPLPKTAPMTVTAADEALPLLRAGDGIDALFFEEALDVFGPSSRVLARFENGKPAVVASTFGRGKALIAGSFPGSAYHHFKNPSNEKFFAGLADWTGVRKPVEVASPDPDVLVEARILEGSGYRLLFAFNRGERATRAAFTLPVRSKSPAVRELESGRRVEHRTAAAGLVVEKDIVPGEVWVLVIEDGD